MFFLNTAIDYAIVDYDFLVNPDLYISKLASQTKLYISIVSENLDPDEEEVLKNRYSELITLYSVNDLDNFLRHRPWSFKDIFITGNVDRIAIANSKAVGTILISDTPSYAEMRVGSDLVLSDSHFDALLTNGFRVGNLGEVVIEDARDLVAGDRGKKWNLELMKFKSNHPEFEYAYSLGRFLASDDPFLRIHLYSRFIKIFKGDPNRFGTFTNILMDQAFQKIAQEENLGQNYAITYVPKKPHDPFDRNQILLANLKAEKGYVYTDALKCIRQYETQKNVKGQHAKRENVRKAFTPLVNFHGMPVILVDDVYTSGATQAECAQMLLDANASRVIPVSLGLFCPASAPALLSLSCERCGSLLGIQFGTQTGRPFWGCPNYKSSPGHTRHFYAEGVRKLRKIWDDAENDKFPF